tara:strand:+ start:585 stop:926 length:342 start_codon:yes stop_codon:yes gene_type:complete
MKLPKKDLNRYHSALQVSIKNRKEWITYYLIKLRWKTLRSEVNRHMIWNNPIISIFLFLIYLPTKLLKYSEYLKLKYELKETQKEIEVLEKEVLYVDHLRWNEKDNDHLKLFK